MKSLTNRISRKRLANILLLQICILLVTSCLVSFPASAAGEDLVEPWKYEDGTNYPITDDAGLLTDDEVVSLCEKIQNFENTYQTSLVILTINNLGNRSEMEYADDFFDYKGFGYGSSREGVILLVDMGSRAYWISTSGHETISKFTDNNISKISDNFEGYLSDGNYYDAFDSFIYDCDLVMSGNFNKFTAFHLAMCVIAGLILALIPLFAFVGQLRTVAPAAGASSYTTNKLQLSVRRDQFLHHHVSRTRIQSESSGGSSTHTSSSGSSHGGGGGHF